MVVFEGLEGKTALVTGATKNIGRGIAEYLASAGTTVAVNGRDPAAVDEVVRSIRQSGGCALPALADVTSDSDVSKMFERVLAETSTVDIVVNNAVSRVYSRLNELDLDDLRGSFGVTVEGALRCIRAAAPGMRGRGWGRIVQLVGLGGQRGSAGHLVTATSKNGVIGLTKALAHELGPDGITVNAVSPGVIDTDRPAVLGDDEAAKEHYRRVEAAVREIPVQRMGTIREIAAVTAFLCTDDAAFVTGQVIGVNGGAYT